MSKPARPTKAEIETQLTQLKSYYSARNTAFTLDDQYYELRFRDALGLPDEYKEDGVVLPTGRDIVEAGTNHVSTIYAKFVRPTRGNSPEEVAQAEMLRKFDVGMYYRTKMEAPTSPWRTATKHGCLYGMWCYESVYDPDRVPDEPERADSETKLDYELRKRIFEYEVDDSIPIRISAVHPACVYPEPSDNPSHFILERTKTVSKVMKDWPGWNPLMSRNPVASLHYIGGVLAAEPQVLEVSYWTPYYRAVYVDGVPVLGFENEGVYEHDYGFIPYTIGYSGLGNEDSVAAPEKRAVGLIRYLRNLLRSESFAYSVYNIILKAHSWPITFVSGPGAASIANMKLKFGKIYEKPAGVTIEDYVKSAPPEIVREHMIYTNGMLGASGAPNSVRGLPEAGVRSGSDRSLVISEASLKYDTIMEQMQSSTAKVMANCTKIAERVVPDDIHIWAKTPDEEFDVVLEKDKIKGHYTTFVEFLSSAPEEEARRHADGINLVKAGVLSTQTMRRRYLAHIDPVAEDIKVEAEKLRSDPSVRQLLGQLVAAELQGEISRLLKIRALMEREAALSGGGSQTAPGAGNLPSSPSGAMASGPGMAQAVSEAMRTGQATAHQPARQGSPEQMAAIAAATGAPTTGGGLRVPGVQGINEYPGAVR